VTRRSGPRRPSFFDRRKRREATVMTQGSLTKRQLDTLRRKLQDERRRIVALLREPLPSMPADEPQEYEETAQRATEQEEQLERNAPERALLADIDRALGKMDDGGYGVSERTGEPIPYERLAAVPWARQGVDE
jgi:DnaK suppressor protein